MVILSRRLTVKIDPHNERNIGFRAVFRVSLGWRTGVPELAFTGRVSCTGFSLLLEGNDTLSLAVSESQAHFRRQGEGMQQGRKREMLLIRRASNSKKMT